MGRALKRMSGRTRPLSTAEATK